MIISNIRSELLGSGVHDKNADYLNSQYDKLKRECLTSDITVGKEDKILLLKLESEIERVFAERYIRGNTSNIELRLCQVKWLIESELEALCSYSNEITILGSGAMPITALIALSKGYKVNLVDISPHYIDLSKKVICKKFGTANKASFFLSDASEFVADVTDPNFVMSGHLPDKNELVNKELERSKKARILLRQPDGLFTGIYNEIKLSAKWRVHWEKKLDNRFTSIVVGL